MRTKNARKAKKSVRTRRTKGRRVARPVARMSSGIDVIHDDKHTVEFIDDAAMAFMALTVHRLNTALTECGVADVAVRQEVCSKFLFEFAYHHDAGWFSRDGNKLYPLVALAERRDAKPDENLGKIAVLHVPTQATSWHEYACGVVSRYFESDEESVDAVRFGSYGEES